MSKVSSNSAQLSSRSHASPIDVATASSASPDLRYSTICGPVPRRIFSSISLKLLRSSLTCERMRPSSMLLDTASLSAPTSPSLIMAASARALCALS